MTALHFRPAISWAVDVEDFRRWLQKAAAGDRIDYAGGPSLPHGFPVVAEVRRAIDAGLVLSHHLRGDGGHVYAAVRRADPSRPARGAGRPIAGSVAARMLSILEKAAQATRPCPTNAVLAVALNLRNSEQARYIFGRLVDAGLIAVENRGPKQRRIVTILATGARTASGEAR